MGRFRIFPQPSSQKSITRSQEVYRLFGNMRSSGDIYELDIATGALVVGPNSDIPFYDVVYFDPEREGSAERLKIGVDSPFVGRLDAILTSRYGRSNTFGRILVTPSSLFEPDTLPSTADPTSEFVDLVRPRIDVLAYNTNVPAHLPSRRADFEYKGNLVINDKGAGTGSTHILIPWYGRRLFSCVFHALPAGSWNVSVDGLRYTRPDAPFFTEIITSTALQTGGADTTFTVRAQNDGLFDYIHILVSGDAIDGQDSANGIFYDIRTSDRESI